MLCHKALVVIYITYILVISNELQQYAGVYLVQNYPTCFGCLSHPSSGVHRTLTVASGTGHIVRGCSYSLMYADDGCDRMPKHVG